MPVGVGRELREAAREDSHPIPSFEIPDGFERNEPMCDDTRTEVGLRDAEFEWFIEITSVAPLATIEGPYYAELVRRVGGRESFETALERRLVGIEPGAVEYAVAELAWTADFEGGESR
ncbi:hypothetical protein SAMN05443636_1078 [Halobaculum gomorrense]|uniref:Uncharacterized protein n=2 Tax=Halobaculum gomorrense TaxID=43928 RepID=A0A1M5MPQ2_9EURY|nr:hypothetical protein SAMN05443636_1078 [Halobaculum gomorrense]